VIVTYAWKLNDSLIFQSTDSDELLKAIDIHEFPRSLVSLQDKMRIAKSSPYGLHSKRAQQYLDQATQLHSRGRPREALFFYQRCVDCLERFRNPSILSTVAECYLRCADCALACDRPARARLFVRCYLTIGDVSPRVMTLKNAARKRDEVMVGAMEGLLDKTGTSVDLLAWAAGYLLDYPLQKRVRLAEALLGEPEAQVDNPSIHLARARLYMHQARWHDAQSLLTVAAREDEHLRRELDSWTTLMTNLAETRKPLFADTADELDPVDSVNRGLTYLVNAFYDDANWWFLNALTKAPADPFAIFGHALVLWRYGWFALAMARLEEAKGGIENYPREFRFVTFARDDQTCPPMNYKTNPIYPIFSPNECLEQVSVLQPFVSHAIAP
jgi:tetratricopeptide (TPR) repeat protein